MTYVPRWLAAAALTTLCWAPCDARAGARDLEVVLVNMTPNEFSDEASKKCAADVFDGLQAEYVRAVRMEETPLRKRAGKTNAKDSFMAWRAKDLGPVKERGDQTWADTVVLFDCQPTRSFAQVLIAPNTNGVTRLTLRDVPIDDERAKDLAAAILPYAWVGFSP